jgi:hypothetical protein
VLVLQDDTGALRAFFDASGQLNQPIDTTVTVGNLRIADETTLSNRVSLTTLGAQEIASFDPVSIYGHARVYNTNPGVVPLEVYGAGGQTGRLFSLRNGANQNCLDLYDDGALMFWDGVGGIDPLGAIGPATSTPLPAAASGALKFTSALGIGPTAPDLGGGAGAMLFLAECTAPPAVDPTGGGILYVQGGALNYRGPAGTVTVIAPA